MILPFILLVLIHVASSTPPQTCTCQNADPSQAAGFSAFPGFQPAPQPQFQPAPQPQFQGFATPGPAIPQGSCPPPIQFNCPPAPPCPPQAPCHTPHPFFATHPFFTSTVGPTVGPTLGQFNQGGQNQGQGGQDCGGVTPAPGSYNAIDQQTAAPTYQQPQPLQPLPEQPQQGYGSQGQSQQGYYQQGGQQPLPVAEQGQGQQPQVQALPQGQYPQQVQSGQYQGQEGQYGQQVQTSQYQQQGGQYQGQQQVPQGQEGQYQGQQLQQGQEGQQGQFQGQEAQQGGQYSQGQQPQRGNGEPYQNQESEQMPDGSRSGNMNIHVYREGENTQADYVEGEENAGGQNAPENAKKTGTMDYDTNSESIFEIVHLQPKIFHRQKQLGAPTIDVIDETKCNNEKLRKIMLEVTDDNPSTSKRKIQKEAMEKIGGIFDVICSNGDFSYLANTRLYCETRVKETICFAFLHNALP
ncbi:hypothetical protein L596_022262 [Steinernema carpocapsae]|uniref:Ground-like domain-containing protein n=1 Tax=Steinernema carpocapsae TaxID=34508 RepID=A0A4U5MLA9_STECR|nr:hypothetical protein L596_022262 [Steinernema carpocapsae]